MDVDMIDQYQRSMIICTVRSYALYDVQPTMYSVRGLNKNKSYTQTLTDTDPQYF